MLDDVNYVMDKLINELDKIIRWPKKPSAKEMKITFLATKFDSDKTYTEKEVNKIIDMHHLFNDTPLLIRELISRRLLGRINDGSKYWRIY